jgi:ferrous iron transport protein A
MKNVRGGLNLILSLDYLFIGQKGKIRKLELADESSKNRLLAMGIIPGKVVELVHISPFGDPLVFKVEEKKVVLRKSEASKISVEVSYKVYNLSSTEKGSYEVISLMGGEKFLQDLAKIGLNIGSKFDLIDKKANKIVIMIDGKKYIMGKGRASKIYCKKVS